MTSPGRETDCKGEPPCGLCHECLAKRVLTYRIELCGLCIAGEGGECHSPGCAMFLNRAPDIPLTEPMCSLIPAPPQIPESEPGESEGEPPAKDTEGEFCRTHRCQVVGQGSTGLITLLTEKNKPLHFKVPHLAAWAFNQIDAKAMQFKIALEAIEAASWDSGSTPAPEVVSRIYCLAHAALARPESETREERKG